jgi:hypothetical protein
MNKVKCPKCGSEQIVALERRPDKLEYDIQNLGIQQLPHNRGEIHAGVVGYENNIYAIARCIDDHCGINYMVEKYSRSSPWKVQSIRPSVEKVGEGLPTQVEEAYKQAKVCLAVDCPDGSIAMCRASLDRMSKDKNAEGSTLAARLDNLVKKGILKASLITEAINVKNFGNAALHDLLAEEISNEDAEIICDFTKGILTDIYVTSELAMKATRRIGEVKKGKAKSK